MKRLEGKVALISGGARGLGLGISKVFVADGAKVVMMGRTQAWGEEAVEKLTAAGGEAVFCAGDVTEEADVERVVDETVERFGALHLVVNNAGLASGRGRRITETTLEQWRRYFAINIDGPFLLCKHAIPRMLEAGYGSVVNISSNAAIRAMPGLSALASSKAAMHGLTMTVAVEYGPTVRCNELVIGHLHPENPDNPVYQYMEQHAPTKRAIEENFLVGRWGTPDDLGNLCAFLCSEQAGFITASTLRLDGGSQQVMRFPSLDGFPAWHEERLRAAATVSNP